MVSKRRQKEVNAAIERYKTIDRLKEAFNKGEIPLLTFILAARKIKKGR